MIGKKTILVAPLDWGLGHATRCVPIIRELLRADFEVIIAAEGLIKTLLALEFPQLRIIFLHGYKIRYPKAKGSMAWSMIKQMPRIITTIKSEHWWLNNAIHEHKIDAVISDNRYGLYNRKLPAFFITHQLLIKSPFLQKSLQNLNYKFINRFTECWIPDYEGPQNLAGMLSHPIKTPSIPLRYIGALSRLKPLPSPSAEAYILILLSGPEPQRSLLEEQLLGQLKNFKQKVLVVRGLPDAMDQPDASEYVSYLNYLPSPELEEAIHNASFVIARSGYSTVMDLIKLRKKSILIPTPGQTEQEYLGESLSRKKLALCISQQEFKIEQALRQALVYPYDFFDETTNELLCEAVGEIENKISAHR